MSRWTEADVPDQTGRTAVVTGSNAGLGFEVARVLARAGATVVLACRNPARAATAAARIRSVTHTADVRPAPLDLAELDSIAAFADLMVADHGGLDLLVNNAGLMAVDPQVTRDGFELQFGVNHLGHFALTARLLPLLLASTASRVITVSSMGHRASRRSLSGAADPARGNDRWAAYYDSKLANLLFTAELQRRLAATHAPTLAVAAHPGASRTDLGTEGNGFSNLLMRWVVPLTTQPARIGALGTLRAATDPAVRGGEFYAPRFMALGYPTTETPSRRARDREAATRLWNDSVELTGVEPALSRG